MPHTIKHNEKLAESLLKENLSPVIWCGERHSPEKIEKEMRKFEASDCFFSCRNGYKKCPEHKYA